MMRVKIISGYAVDYFAKQFPNSYCQWGEYQFVFDLEDPHYDWLVVIDNVPRYWPWYGKNINCPQDHTIFVATEPSAISYYGSGFVGQFSYLITNQDEQALPHRHAWRTQPGSRWFYEKPYYEIKQDAPYEKTRLLSMIATQKTEKHTLHERRFQFIQQAATALPEADIVFSWKRLEDVFHDLYKGRAQYVAGKSAMIDPYKYHLAIGNQEGPHILTERVVDALLGFSVPISFGCTNLGDYFPKDSFIEIDLYQPDLAIEHIRSIIYDVDDYKRRLNAVCEARERILKNYNLIAMVTSLITQHQDATHNRENGYLYNRRLSRILHRNDLIGFMKFKANIVKHRMIS
jgi:hypothetical protein